MTLDITQLTYTLRGRHLIRHITLSCHPGKIIGILGPNGSGKSTLLKTLARIWLPTEGEVHWMGKNLRTFARDQLSRILTLVPQHPQLHFDLTAYALAAMGRYPHGGRSIQGEVLIEQALRQVDGWQLRDQLISHLSGGEKQRIYIARALATEAPILLLDEPTAYLDLRHQLEIWELLQRLAQEGKLVIVALHDLLAAQKYCDDLIVLNKGLCHATGSYASVMTPKLMEEIFGVEAQGNGSFTLCLRIG